MRSCQRAGKYRLHCHPLSQRVIHRLIARTWRALLNEDGHWNTTLLLP
jgi:hypothetical protein